MNMVPDCKLTTQKQLAVCGKVKYIISSIWICLDVMNMLHNKHDFSAFHLWFMEEKVYGTEITT